MKVILLTCSCWFIIQICFSDFLFAEPKKHIAVLFFTARNSSSAIAQSTYRYFIASMKKNKHYSITDNKNLIQAYRSAGVRSMKCSKPGCATRIGKKLFSDYVITGEIRKNQEDYTLTITLISVLESRIYLRQSQNFVTSIDSSIASDSIIAKISSVFSEKNAKMKHTNLKKKKPNPDFFLLFQFGYQLPVNKMAELVNPGLGLQFSFGFSNLFNAYTGLGISTGFYWFNGKINSEDSVLLAPFFTGLYITAPLFSRLELVFELLAGFYYGEVYHKSGKGFNMDANSKKYSLEAAARPGVSCAFSLLHNLQLYAGTRYSLIFEKNRKIGLVSFDAGLRILF